MAYMNDFSALVHSLGEHIVGRIGKENLASVTVAGDELTETAEVTISLIEETWAAEERAVDVMVELRQLFMDDLSFDYRFVSRDAATRSASTKAPTLQFA